MPRASTFRSAILSAVIALAPLPLSASVPEPGLASHRIPATVATIHHSGDRASLADCEVVQPAQALATPDPLLDSAHPQSRVEVSFIIGIDGRVHSPVILQSAGSAEDDLVLQTLRFWRYRPATCNTAPTEMESKVEFSMR